MESKEVRNNPNYIDACGIGIDLANDYSQISYVTKDMNEPKSISTIPGESKYLIPTIMYKVKNSDDWYIGDQAKLKSFEDDDEHYTVRKLLELVYAGKELYLDDTKYTAKALLKIFIKKLLDEAKRLENVEKTRYISVTVEKSNRIIIDTIYEILEELGYEKAQIRVLSHTESFIYYAINQKKELWMNDVVVFDFNWDHFSYRKLSIARNKKPSVISIVEKDFSDDITMSNLETDRDKRNTDEKFLNIIKEEFYKQIISTVFLTGVGFYTDFAENSLVELCSKRRVFKGHNLFVKGACYDALLRYNDNKLNEFVIQCEGRTRANVGLMINNGGHNSAISLSTAGSSWYEAGARAECILDDVKCIQLVVTSPYGDCIRNVKVDLSEFPDRPNKTTRVSISMSFRDDNTFDVVVEDLGFGDFYKGTNITIKNTYSVDEILV